MWLNALLISGVRGENEMTGWMKTVKQPTKQTTIKVFRKEKATMNAQQVQPSNNGKKQTHTRTDAYTTSFVLPLYSFPSTVKVYRTKCPSSQNTEKKVTFASKRDEGWKEKERERGG